MARRRKRNFLSRWIKPSKVELNAEIEERTIIILRTLGVERNFQALEELAEMCMQKIHTDQTRISNAGDSGKQDHFNGQIEGINYLLCEIMKIINFEKGKNKLTRKKKRSK